MCRASAASQDIGWGSHPYLSLPALWYSTLTYPFSFVWFSPILFLFLLSISSNFPFYPFFVLVFYFPAFPSSSLWYFDLFASLLLWHSPLLSRQFFTFLNLVLSSKLCLECLWSLTDTWIVQQLKLKIMSYPNDNQNELVIVYIFGIISLGMHYICQKRRELRKNWMMEPVHF